MHCHATIVGLIWERFPYKQNGQEDSYTFPEALISQWPHLDRAKLFKGKVKFANSHETVSHLLSVSSQYIQCLTQASPIDSPERDSWHESKSSSRRAVLVVLFFVLFVLFFHLNSFRTRMFCPFSHEDSCYTVKTIV